MDTTWTQESFEHIRRTVSGLVGTDFPHEISAQRGAGLTVAWEGGDACVIAEDRSALARGCFLLAQAMQDGKMSLHIREERQLRSCGVQIDCSRGAVMTAAAVKKYIDCLAALGLNLLLLYTEDTYTVPEYPYFGYQRGRYSPEEMREIDRYAAQMGVELVPCIQTLAHLEQFLQWGPAAHLRDHGHCLLIDEEETYALIEAQIRAMRSYVATDRIHIGMDEAYGVGLGRYYEKHGPTDRVELLRRHLERVVDICKKYGLKPMMWCDMFFSLGSESGSYYDPDYRMPQRVIDMMPDVGMVYWDYYHTDEATYDHMLTELERIGRETIFAGGIWTWSGFLPQVDWTNATMQPALRVCARHRVQTVYATMWGDSGNETNQFLALNQLPLFSEFCWRGEDCTPAEIAHMGETLTGLTQRSYEAFSYFYNGAVDERTGKALVYGDLLYPLLPGEPDLEARIRRYETGREMLAPQLDRQDCRYADALFDLAIGKARAILTIRAAYEAGDRAALRRVAEQDIPCLIEKTVRLEEEHRINWYSAFKRNGWEIFPLRYGSVRGRMQDVARTLIEYADGRLDTLCELDERLPMDRSVYWGGYRGYVSPQVSFGMS